MNRDKREVEYPIELESQFILRLPEEPAKVLREVLRTGENLKNRLTIQIENDMRHGEVRLDHWLMHSKIVDLPTIIESLKTIDNKSFYKTADICQMMICKDEPDQTPIEEETPSKNKKKDPYKVDKKFLWPHGITPPTKNVRKRRFRKTLKKKCAEAPEIEKEVKRLLRADNEAVSVTWEVIKEDDGDKQDNAPPAALKPEKKKGVKREAVSAQARKPNTSNVVDIFGGAVSDSDVEDDINVEMEDLSETSSRLYSEMQSKKDNFPVAFDSQMFRNSKGRKKRTMSRSKNSVPATSTVTKSGGLSSDDDGDYQLGDLSKDRSLSIDKLKVELEELKQRKLKIQNEIAGMENLALKQRFQETLHTLSQEVMYKEMQYQGLITLQNSEDI